MAEPAAKVSGTHMNLFLWLQRWEEILSKSSKNGLNLHISELLGNTGFWSWVPQWPDEEMKLFLKTITDIRTFIKLLGTNCNNYKVETLLYFHDRNWRLKECLTQWQECPNITQSILQMLAKPEDYPIINQEKTTHVVQIQLHPQKSQAPTMNPGHSAHGNNASRIKIDVWMQRWNRLMQMMKEAKNPKGGVKELQLETWKTEWEDDPMTFLCDSLQKFQEVILPAKEHQKQSQRKLFELPNKDLNLYAMGNTWLEVKHHNQKMMAHFRDSDEAGAFELQAAQQLNTSSSASIVPKTANSQKLSDERQVNAMFQEAKQGQHFPDTGAKAQTALAANKRPHTSQGFYDDTTKGETYGEKPRQNPGVAWQDAQSQQHWPRGNESYHTEDKHHQWVQQGSGLMRGQNVKRVAADKETEEIIQVYQRKIGEKEDEVKLWKQKYDALNKEKPNKSERKSLQRTVSSYGERRPSEYTDEARQKICHLEACIKERDETISTLIAKNNQIQAEADRYSTELSRMMQRELSRDESALENISLKHRPMTIADQYREIQTAQWLGAKEALDQHAEDCLTERQRNEFLMDLMMNCFKTMKVMHQSQREQFQRVLDNPMQVHSLVPNEPSAVKPEIRLTSQLQESIARYLKIQCGAMDFRDLSKEMVERLAVKLEGLNHKITEKIKRSQRIQEFCNIFASLAWKMVVQTPPMDFDQGDVGKSFSDAKHEPHWGSMNENEKGVMILYYVYPTLYHNKQVMVKGRVFLGKPEKNKT